MSGDPGAIVAARPPDPPRLFAARADRLEAFFDTPSDPAEADTIARIE